MKEVIAGYLDNYDLIRQSQRGFVKEIDVVGDGLGRAEGLIDVVGDGLGRAEGLIDVVGDGLGGAGGLIDVVGDELGRAGGLIDVVGDGLGRAGGVIDVVGDGLGRAGAVIDVVGDGLGRAGGVIDVVGDGLGRAGGVIDVVGDGLGRAGGVTAMAAGLALCDGCWILERVGAERERLELTEDREVQSPGHTLPRDTLSPGCSHAEIDNRVCVRFPSSWLSESPGDGRPWPRSHLPAHGEGLSPHDLPQSLCFPVTSERQCIVIDNQSLNGVWINGKRIEPQQPHPLKEGDVIQLGVPLQDTEQAEYRYRVAWQRKVLPHTVEELGMGSSTRRKECGRVKRKHSHEETEPGDTETASSFKNKLQRVCASHLSGTSTSREGQGGTAQRADPDTSREGQGGSAERTDPDTTEQRHPDTSREGQGGTSQRADPDTSRECQGGTAQRTDPDTSREGQGGTAQRADPDTTEQRHPDTSREGQGGTAQWTDPDTSREGQGGTAQRVDPDTSREGQGGSAERTDPDTTEQSHPDTSREGQGGTAQRTDPDTSRERQGGTAQRTDPDTSREGQGGTAQRTDPDTSREGQGGSAVRTDPDTSREGQGGTAQRTDPDTSREGQGGSAAECVVPGTSWERKSPRHTPGRLRALTEDQGESAQALVGLSGKSWQSKEPPVQGLARQQEEQQRHLEGQQQTSLRTEEQQRELQKLKAALRRQRKEVADMIRTKDRELEESKITVQKAETATQFADVLENELQCIICSEYFVEAVTLNCSHSFCCHCILEWRKRKEECPICRQPICSQSRSIVLDNCIERMLESLSDSVREHRLQLINQRKALKTKSTSLTKSASSSFEDLTSVHSISTESSSDIEELSEEGETEEDPVYYII
ncbi:E3 ubiquitin-protein ligase rnf8 [Scyliorhinus torazame]|uniref:E3 ubiquitin-protein ligase rnf8 n=1 Tax=Scyliorhinus torazame TaxID=75743 RepID=UPI003B59F70D